MMGTERWNGLDIVRPMAVPQLGIWDIYHDVCARR